MKILFHLHIQIYTQERMRIRSINVSRSGLTMHLMSFEMSYHYMLHLLLTSPHPIRNLMGPLPLQLDLSLIMDTEPQIQTD